MKRIWLGLAAIALLSAPNVHAKDTSPPSADLIIGWREIGQDYAGRALAAEGKAKWQNYEKAETWWRKAADAGDAEALYLLGNLYARHYSITGAAGWYLRAAQGGHIQAMVILGTYYAEGRDDFQADAFEAERWWLMAAQAGNAEAQYRVGSLYHTRALGEPDHVKGALWQRRAADQDWPAAVSQVCRALLEFAPEQAEPYCAKPAMANHPQQLTVLGLNHAYGWNGAPVDSGLALGHLRQASAQGEAVATSTLGRLYEGGLFLPKDPAQAAGLYRQAMLQSNAQAAWFLGQLYETGQGVAADREESNRLRWLSVQAATRANLMTTPQQAWKARHPEFQGNWLAAHEVSWWNSPLGTWTVETTLPDGTMTEIGASDYLGLLAQDAYPVRALEDEVVGSVLLHCRWNRGELDNCLVLEETPAGYGFAAAAVDLYARAGRLKQKDEWIRQSKGKSTYIRFRFRL
ncbi:sel1 repeat family protein [Asticcacaulis biprosthecium C19]|uniref:Sel1 repeat family protein n=1 Tax=Asticcacaulis biprosthecium C19 TaxID=715226 RepID=F4QS88_9CAUL|nr:tetratricopeptide repeat protein [Asticcacaulis biprosthecium]EGF89608.1 sel1 repeat family protein [Asticcacaulis biprosthecium C19]